MLEKVVVNNDIIRAYQKFPSSGVHSIPAELKQIIDACYLSKCGGKRKPKAAPSVGENVSKKFKKPVQNQGLHLRC